MEDDDIYFLVFIGIAIAGMLVIFGYGEFYNNLPEFISFLNKWSGVIQVGLFLIFTGSAVLISLSQREISRKQQEITEEQSLLSQQQTQMTEQMLHMTRAENLPPQLIPRNANISQKKDSKEKSLEFEIVNEGPGAAKKLRVEDFSARLKEEEYEEEKCTSNKQYQPNEYPMFAAGQSLNFSIDFEPSKVEGFNILLEYEDIDSSHPIWIPADEDALNEHLNRIYNKLR